MAEAILKLTESRSWLIEVMKASKGQYLQFSAAVSLVFEAQRGLNPAETTQECVLGQFLLWKKHRHFTTDLPSLHVPLLFSPGLVETASFCIPFVSLKSLTMEVFLHSFVILTPLRKLCRLCAYTGSPTGHNS